MRRLGLRWFLAGLVAVGAFAGFGFFDDGQMTRAELREMLVQLGYEVTDVVKDAGKEKFSVNFAKSDLNIPVGFEISPSNSYIWLTVNLGDAPKESSAKCLNLLKQNAKVQPTFFYVTDAGRMMAALPIENRNVSNAILRLRAETISDNVGKTKETWQAQ